MRRSTPARPTKVAFLNTHPIQYFAPMYAYLNRTPYLDVAAVYLADYSIRGGHDLAFGQPVQWDVDLVDGYDAQFVTGAERRREPQGFLSMVVPQLARHFTREKFDAVVVHGHTPAAMLVGAAAAKLSGAGVFMRCDTHLGLRRSAMKIAFRRPMLGSLYGLFDGALAIGSANAAFYRAMGLPRDRIHLMPFAVDNARFAHGANLSAHERARLRASLGVCDERPVVLYAAKFQPGKRPADLLQALARLDQENTPYHLVMAGSGELDGSLRQLAASLGIRAIYFTGFVNQAALPGLYGACDVFVLPSERDSWGLAVNEAMCAALPIVATSELGCIADLVDDGVNGLVYPAGDVTALSAALARILADRDRLRRMGQESKRIISHWSYAECLQGLRGALAAIGRGAPDPEIAEQSLR